SGRWAVWLGGADDEVSILSQQVIVPAGQAVLSYYHWIGSEDACGFDFAGVSVNGTAVSEYTLCAQEETAGWARKSVNLAAYAGQSVMLEFWATTDGSGISSLFLDDVAFVSAAQAGVLEQSAGPDGGAAPGGGAVVDARRGKGE